MPSAFSRHPYLTSAFTLATVLVFCSAYNLVLRLGSPSLNKSDRTAPWINLEYTEWLIALVPTYGLWLIAACTCLSCLALPIPASILLLAAGGFVAVGDLSLAGSVGAALAGAVVGDQFGFMLGRWGGTRLIKRLGSRAAPIGRARHLLAVQGAIAVFLSRWLVSPLGPYVNFAAGAAGFPWLRFTFWGIAGEAIWVALYIGLGYVFTGNLRAASDMAVHVLALLGAGAVAIWLGAWLFASVPAKGQKWVQPEDGRRST